MQLTDEQIRALLLIPRGIPAHVIWASS